MTYDFLSRHLRNQIVRTPKPSLLTAITISSTPSYYPNYIIDHLTDIYYLKSAALSVIRKAASCLNT